MEDRITIIKAKKSIISFDFGELWEYRELLLVMAIRDIKVRYKQTFMGASWAIIQPLAQMVIFSFFFGKLAKIPSEGIPYPIFSYSGLLLWLFFSNSVAAISNSMIVNTGILKKVYFPRLIIPLSSSIVFLVDYLIAFIILLCLIVFFHFSIRIEYFLLPLIVFLTWLLSIGLGCLFASLNVKYRDLRIALPFLIQLLMYATPVIYPASVAGQFQWIVNINPLTGLIETHRALILNLKVNMLPIFLSVVFTLFTLLIGLLSFRKMEKDFIDIV
jgi:lipopolysaccharide transport system permease protein